MLWINTTKLCSTMLTQDAAFLSKIKSWWAEDTDQKSVRDF